MSKKLYGLFPFALGFLLLCASLYWYNADETATASTVNTIGAIVSWLATLLVWVSCAFIYAVFVDLANQIQKLENDVEVWKRNTESRVPAARVASEPQTGPVES